MSEIMEVNSADVESHNRKSKFKLTSFPDYVRRVQQLTRNQTTSASQTIDAKSRSKRQNLSRTFSCFADSSNSPHLKCRTRLQPVAQLPPLQQIRNRKLVKKLPLAPYASQESNSNTDQLRTDNVLLHRASSFPLITSNDNSLSHHVPKSKPLYKSPYLQPLVHKSYYRKEIRNLKVQRTRLIPKPDEAVRRRSHTIHEISADKEDKTVTMDTECSSSNEPTSLPIPSITLRAATPSGNSDVSTSLIEQFTARQQLAAELDKLNREVQDLVVSVDDHN